MDKNFIRERITALRLKKGISEYKMSYDMGHSKNYINNIMNNDTLPALSELLYICEYFGISVSDFFVEVVENPVLVRKVTALAKELKEEDLNAVITVMEQLLKKKEQRQPR